MENERMLTLQTICTHYNIERDFLNSLVEYGLIEVVTQEDVECIKDECLSDIEMMMHLHYDLEINLAGIDAISHLLKRVKEMQQEVKILRNKLDIID